MLFINDTIKSTLIAFKQQILKNKEIVMFNITFISFEKSCTVIKIYNV